MFHPTSNPLYLLPNFGWCSYCECLCLVFLWKVLCSLSLAHILSPFPQMPYALYEMILRSLSPAMKRSQWVWRTDAQLSSWLSRPELEICVVDNTSVTCKCVLIFLSSSCHPSIASDWIKNWKLAPCCSLEAELKLTYKLNNFYQHLNCIFTPWFLILMCSGVVSSPQLFFVCLIFPKSFPPKRVLSKKL